MRLFQPNTVKTELFAWIGMGFICIGELWVLYQLLNWLDWKPGELFWMLAFFASPVGAFFLSEAMTQYYYSPITEEERSARGDK